MQQILHLIPTQFHLWALSFDQRDNSNIFPIRLLQKLLKRCKTKKAQVKTHAPLLKITYFTLMKLIHDNPGSFIAFIERRIGKLKLQHHFVHFFIQDLHSIFYKLLYLLFGHVSL